MYLRVPMSLLYLQPNLLFYATSVAKEFIRLSTTDENDVHAYTS